MTALVALVCVNQVNTRVGYDEGHPGSRSGAPRVAWRIAEEGQGTPAVHAGRAYFLTRRHEVVAVDVESGRLRWRSSTGTNGPAVIGTRVYATGDLVVAGDGSVVAFDAHDGRLRWRFAPPESDGAGLYVGDISNSTVFIGSPAGQVHAVELATGLPQWTATIWPDDPATIYSPALDRERVVASYTRYGRPSTGGLVALDATTGVEQWRKDFPRAVHGANGGAAGGPVVAGALVIAANRDGTIWAFDRGTGVIRWSLPPILAQDFRPLASSGNTLIAGSLSGLVVAYDLDTVQERWRQASSETSVAFGITLDASCAYVPYLSGELVALDLATGEERWRTDATIPGINWVPHASGTRVMVSSSNALLALEP